MTQHHVRWRRQRRGFLPLYMDLIHASKPQTLLEWGCTGGTSHWEWQNMGMTVTGFDILDYPELTVVKEHSREKFRRKCEQTFEYDLDLHWGWNSNSADTVERFPGPWDIIIDDGNVDATIETSMETFLRWQPTVNGFYFSETLDGNGVDHWFAVSREQHIANYQVAAQHGFWVYDMAKHSYSDELESTFIGVWSPNINDYAHILEKYERVA